MTGHKNGEPGPVHWGDTWCLCLGPTGSQLVSSKCQAEMPTRDGTWPSSLGRHLVLVPRPHWESTGFIQLHSFTFNFLNYLKNTCKAHNHVGARKSSCSNSIFPYHRLMGPMAPAYPSFSATRLSQPFKFKFWPQRPGAQGTPSTNFPMHIASTSDVKPLA
jgi:hypothetical protein